MRYQILLTFSLAILFSESLIGQVADKNFKVVVTDSGTAAPLPFATVCWQSLSDKASGNGVANANGEVMIRSQGGRVVLSVSCLGYRPLRDTVVLSSPMVLSLSEDIFNLEQVTVTGTRTPRTIKESAVFTQMLTRKDISGISAATIKDVLEMEMPSLEINQHGNGNSITAQGMEGKYTLVLVDGERMASESDGNIDLSRINAANIEQIEVVRGASSTLYGSNAMGNVINVISRKPQSPFSVSVDLRYAQPNQQNNTASKISSAEDGYLKDYYRNQDLLNLNGDITMGYRFKRFYGNSYFGFKSFDGYQLYNSKDDERYYPALQKTVVIPASTVPFSVNGFFDYTFSQKVGITGRQWNSEARGSYYRHEDMDFSRDGTHYLYTDVTLGGYTERRLATGGSVRLSLSHDSNSKFSHREKTGKDNLDNRHTVQSGKLVYTSNLNQRHVILGGIEFNREELRSNRFTSGGLKTCDVTDLVLVVQDEAKITNRLGVVGGLRLGLNSTFNEYYTPSLSAKYALARWGFRFTVAKGFRTPTLKELYMKWDHNGMFWIIGDDKLKPEQSIFYSLSTDYVNSEKKINITGIVSYNQVSQKIDGVWSNNQTQFLYSNMKPYAIFTAELLGRWKVSPSFLLKAGYSFTHLYYDDLEVKPSGSSPHSVTAQVEYGLTHGDNRLVVNLSGKVVGAKKLSVIDENINQFYNVSYPAYQQWNLNVSNTYAERYTFSFGVKNIFDYTSPIVTFNTSTSVGRRFFLLVGYKF